MNKINLFIPDFLFIILVFFPALYASNDDNFYYSELYYLITFTLTAGWFFGSLIGYFLWKKISCKTQKVNKIRNSVIKKITIAISSMAIFGMIIFSNFGIFNDQARLDFEGGLFHKLILLNIFIIASFGLKGNFSFLLLCLSAILSGWKSIFFYAVVAKFHLIKFTTKNIVIGLLGIFILLIIFSVINLLRQGGGDEFKISNYYSFIDVFYYYFIYGFVNFSYSLVGIDFEGLIFPGGLTPMIVNPTWNVQSGFFPLINALGFLLSPFYLMFIRIIGFQIKGQSAINNFLHYVTILTVLLLHNTLIALSTIVILFPVLLFLVNRIVFLKNN